MSRSIYPVLYVVEYASGNIDNRLCNKDWEVVKADLDQAKALGAVKDYRYTTAIDRQVRGLRITRNGTTEPIRTLIRHTELSAKYPPKWRR